MFSNPVLVFLGICALGACAVFAVDCVLFRKGIGTINLKHLAVCTLTVFLFLLAIISAIFPSEVAQAAAAEPQEVVAQPVAPATCIFEYPDAIQPWCFLIEEASLKYGVNPFLIGAVMIQESGGNNEAGQTIQIIDGVEYHTSSSGAVGLIQVMPRDGISSSFQCINGPCFASRPSIQELYDPAFNVHYGTGMLAGLIAKYGDNREALLHYGPDCTLTDPYCSDPYFYADIVLGIYENIKP